MSDVMTPERTHLFAQKRGDCDSFSGECHELDFIACAVADLLGDDEKTVREHYSRWVVERQQRLSRILKDAFGEKPKLTATKGRRG